MRPARFLLLLVSLGVATPALAQRDTTARLTGRASSAFNGRPVSGVMIAVPAVRQFAVTDSTGMFELAGLPARRHKVRIAYQGRETKEYEFQFRRGKATHLVVVLDVEALDLAPVVVEGQWVRGQYGLAGFLERRKIGFGRYYTAEDIERLKPFSVTTLLVREGLTVRCRDTGCVPVQFRMGRYCRMPIYWNGMRLPLFDIDTFQPEAVAGLEIYQRDVEIPVEFMIGGGGCGAILIWTGVG